MDSGDSGTRELQAVPSALAIGIDLGGTNIKGGLCDAAGRLVAQRAVPTEGEHGPDHVIGRMASMARDLLAAAGGQSVRVLGVGAPGPISHARGVIFRAPNLPQWINIPLRDRLSDALPGLVVVLENDANAAAYGEFVAGAGADVEDMAMLTLGTGVGGGVVVAGRLVRGAFDNAGEIGHMIIEPAGRPCPCGQRGCLERYASANAIAERTAEAIAGGARSTLAARVSSGERITSADVLAAARAGDTLAAQVWDSACRYLALAVVNIQHLYNPQLVVFSGGLIQAGAEHLLVPIQRHFDLLRWKIAPDAPRLALATLGTDAGVIGAAALARETLPG